MSNEKPRVLSGIRPTGLFHLGNYLGALKNWVQMQETSDAFYMVVDLHAVADQIDPAQFRESTILSAISLLAIGLDPDKCTIFLQSSIPPHTELTWILSAIATYGELTRMTQFKDKAKAQGGQLHSKVGLFTYPILMAADILAYNAQYVPVGDDQKQHLELTRNLAERFNTRYGQTFVVPEPLIPKHIGRVMDLSDPTAKMSKSARSTNGTIFLNDPPEVIHKKVSRATTDSFNDVIFEPKERPGSSNLLAIYAALTNKEPAELNQSFPNYRELKAQTAEVIIEALRPIREQIDTLNADRAQVYNILTQGKEKALEIATQTLTTVKDKIGIVRL